MNCSTKFVIKVQRSIEKLSRTSEVKPECLEWFGCTDREGYPVKRVTWPSGKCTQSRVQRLVMMLSTGTELAEVDRHGNPMDVSHLCHNKLCIREKHLTIEPHHVNTGRRQCVARGSCLGHEPACIFIFGCR